ncbi:MAG TPA: ATP synthase F0 subunit B [Verrucomicrobiae bacterium]|nr:ATP synthase F0 subunit B [Verrucomicrobiae bacterium]
MDATLRALGAILLNAVPTFLLVFILDLYLKKVFFQPLEKVLRQRFEATEGARKLAEQALARASARTSEYEAAIRAARSEIYQAQEQFYKQLQENQAAEIVAARESAEKHIHEAKAQLGRDVEAAKATLAQTGEALAAEIADRIVREAAA